MKFDLSKFGALVAALLLLTSAVGGAAAIAWDTETTNTTTTSDVDGSTTSLDVYHGDSTNATYFEVSGASTENLTLEITPAEDGVDYVAYANSSAATEDATNGHYSWNVSHDELEDLPRDVDGETYDVVIRNSSNDNEVLNATSITVNNGNQDPKAVMVLTNDTTESAAAKTPLVADRLEISSESPGLLSLSTVDPFSNESETTIASWDGYTTVNGSNTTVEVHMDNSSSADAYSSAAEEYQDGEWVQESTVWINGIPHKVYLNQVPDDVSDDETTVVYDSSADELVIDMDGEEYQDVQTVQMRGGAGEAYAFGELWSNFGATEAVTSLV